MVRAQAHLLVMPPPGGSPGISSAAKNLITYKRSGSSSLDLMEWMISVKHGSKWFLKNDGANIRTTKIAEICWGGGRGVEAGVTFYISRSPSTFISMCCSSSASCCSASCDSWGAPGKQTMMMLMLSKLPWRGRQHLRS